MQIVEKYTSGLKKAYIDNEKNELWEHFENIKHGATKEAIGTIKEKFPAIPKSFIHLLEYVDGTYGRTYQSEEINVYFLGSDLENFPYFFFSSEQLLNRSDKNNEEIISNWLAEQIEWQASVGIPMDDKITKEPEFVKWLHFADCFNNGGFSSLYIDFTPSENGRIGQIVRFLHDPDEFKVIADSFDDYLKMLMNNGYDFINIDFF